MHLRVFGIACHVRDPDRLLVQDGLIDHITNLWSNHRRLALQTQREYMDLLFPARSHQKAAMGESRFRFPNKRLESIKRAGRHELRQERVGKLKSQGGVVVQRRGDPNRSIRLKKPLPRLLALDFAIQTKFRLCLSNPFQVSLYSALGNSKA